MRHFNSRNLPDLDDLAIAARCSDSLIRSRRRRRSYARVTILDWILRVTILVGINSVVYVLLVILSP